MLKNIPIVDIDIQIHYEIVTNPKEVDAGIKNVQLKYEIIVKNKSVSLILKEKSKLNFYAVGQVCPTYN